MKKEILQRIFDDLFQTAQKIVEVKKQQHSRMLFACRVKGGELVDKRLVLLSGDKEADGILLKAAANLTPEDGVCVMVDEAWAKFDLANGLPPIDDHVRVKDIPGAKEGVIFNFFGRDWEACAFCEIKRKPLKLLKGEIYENYTSEGRLSPLSK